MKIPLPKMMRHWREREFERGDSPWPAARRGARLGVSGEAPEALPAAVIAPVIGLLGEWGKARGHFRWLPPAAPGCVTAICRRRRAAPSTHCGGPS